MGQQGVGETRSWFKEAAIQIGSGGSAGFVEVCIMHPMDLVKTRLQIQVKSAESNPHYYTGIWDCLKKMSKNEGFFAYWKGIVPPIFVETPKRAIKFFTFEQYKQFFLFNAAAPTPLTFFCAGLCAGFTEGVVVNPFEVIKVQLQSNRNHITESPSTIAVTKKVIRERGFGLNGLNRGLTATLMRNGIFNGFYFGFYHSVKSCIPQSNNPVREFFTKASYAEIQSMTLALQYTYIYDYLTWAYMGNADVSGCSSEYLEGPLAHTLLDTFISYQIKMIPKIWSRSVPRKVGVGFISGSLASCLNIPFDVAKSRIQGPDGHKYQGTWKTIIAIYRVEGFTALYKGLLPKIVRLGPGGSIMLVVYDYVHDYLVLKFN